MGYDITRTFRFGRSLLQYAISGLEFVGANLHLCLQWVTPPPSAPQFWWKRFRRCFSFVYYSGFRQPSPYYLNSADKPLLRCAVMSWRKTVQCGVRTTSLPYGNVPFSTSRKTQTLQWSTRNFVRWSAVSPHLSVLTEIRLVGAARHLREMYDEC